MSDSLRVSLLPPNALSHHVPEPQKVSRSVSSLSSWDWVALHGSWICTGKSLSQAAHPLHTEGTIISQKLKAHIQPEALV